MEELSRCKFCRISFHSFKDHIYSKKHRQKVLTILKKFKIKVKQAKVLQKDPQVESHFWERGCTFWCHFCEEEHEKHNHLNDATVKCGGFLKHISRFEKKASVKVEEFLTAKEDEFVKKLTDFKKIEYRRQQQQMSCELPESTRNLPGTSFTKDSQMSQAQVTDGYRTVAARGDGLTCISINTASGFHGNIYSGATPPWLTEESSTTSTGTIGPTKDDYVKHLEEEKRRKLPANRVGANTEESASTQWMPAFGRVWSKQSRQQQRKWPFKGGGSKMSRNSKLLSYYKNTVQQRNGTKTTIPETVQGHVTTSTVDTSSWNTNTFQPHSICSNGELSDTVHAETDTDKRLGNSAKQQYMLSQRVQSDLRRQHGITGQADCTQTDLGEKSCDGASTSMIRSNVARPYVRKKHSNNVGLGKIEISPHFM